MAGLHHAPPPFFKRGPAPLVLLTFYVAASIALFVSDLKYQSADLLRAGIAIVVDPLQRLSHMPGGAINDLGDYFQTLTDLQRDNERLRHNQLNTAPNLARLDHLEAENARLRRLLDLQEREKTAGKVAQILYATRDPFSRRIVIDKGLQAGIVAGQPVIDEAGIVGQVTRTFPLSSEVTLITDKNQVAPVQIVRTGQRSVLYGLGDGRLELRYLPINTDINAGDILVTSGLDGLYPAGFPIAQVASVERDGVDAFARIICLPQGGVENFAEVMVLDPRQKQAALPPELQTRPATSEEKPGKPSRKRKPV